MNQFEETKNVYEQALTVNFPLSYDGWLAVRDDLKAAALYVQFYNAITLAWQKAKSDFTPEEDGVSILMQYLIKNVPIIENSANKYCANYIYTVAYNCMGCLRRIKRDINNHKYTQSNIVCDGDDEYDLFEKIVDENSDPLELSLKRRCSEEIYYIIEKLDSDERSYIDFLLGEKKIGKRIIDKQEELLAGLRKKFINYIDVYL